MHNCFHKVFFTTSFEITDIKILVSMYSSKLLIRFSADMCMASLKSYSETKKQKGKESKSSFLKTTYLYL